MLKFQRFFRIPHLTYSIILTWNSYFNISIAMNWYFDLMFGSCRISCIAWERNARLPMHEASMILSSKWKGRAAKMNGSILCTYLWIIALHLLLQTILSIYKRNECVVNILLVPLNKYYLKFMTKFWFCYNKFKNYYGWKFCWHYFCLHTVALVSCLPFQAFLLLPS